MTGKTQTTQALLSGICSLLAGVRMMALSLHESLPDPAEAEEMGEGTIPESPEFALRSDIECLVADFLDPAIRLLLRATGPGGGPAQDGER